MNQAGGSGGPAVHRENLIESLEREGLFVIEWTDAPDVSYPEHSHPGLEVRVVLEGSMLVGTDGREQTLGPGDRIDLPPDTPHWARVGPEGVRYLAGSPLKPGDRT